jgi:hypothetical protein
MWVKPATNNRASEGHDMKSHAISDRKERQVCQSTCAPKTVSIYFLTPDYMTDDDGNNITKPDAKAKSN